MEQRQLIDINEAERYKIVITKKRLLDVKTAADYLSISRAKLYQWINNGKIPSIRIDGKRLFDVYDLDEFVDNLKKDNK
jgi:excisionase family DNA binding protein